jgi:hypothetical protein
MNKYTIRPYMPGDEEAILELHNLSFAGHETRRRQHWNWKFVNNPLKRTEIIVAMRDNGRCMALYSGIKQRFLIDNEPCLCSNQVDVATDQALRQGMMGALLLVELTKQYYANYTGGETKMAWGFPEPALHRIGLRLIKWEVLRDVVFLVRKPEPFSDMPGEIEVRVVDRFGPDADSLWDQCAGEICTGLIRDACYLNWRYADHPDIPHMLFEARDRHSGKLRGLITLRQGGWDESIMSVMDWLVPLDDRAAETALVQQSLRAASQHGKEYIACWFPAPRLQFTRFQLDHAFFAHSTPYQECFRPFIKGYDRRWYDRHWYQTIGDIDFF